MEKQVRVRFAPSPTGPLHIGGVQRLCSTTYLLKKTKGCLCCASEDTDQKRGVAGAENYISDAFKMV